jgi:hypothetical protein
LAEAIRPCMSALPPIPTELMRRNELTRRANRVLTRRSKTSAFVR